jgi:hypothetical protein
MNCPICQAPMTQTNPLVGYCEVKVFCNKRSGMNYHYEHFIRYEDVDHAYHTELVRVPPFQIFRMEDGRLEVNLVTFEPSESDRRVGRSVYNIVLQRQNTPPEDLLRYYYRFQKLKAFI